MKTEIGQCAYCLEAREVTRDHVVSNALFPDEYIRKNVIIAPSCKECNNGFSLDEEFFRNFVCGISAGVSPEAKTLFHSKIKRALTRKPKLAFQTFNAMQLVNLFSRKGKYLGIKTRWNISEEDWRRYFRVLDKYIKGLIYHELGSPLPKGYLIKHFVVTEDNLPQFIEYSKFLGKWNRDNEDVFSYGYNFVPNTFNSVWMTVFYKNMYFPTMVMTQEQIDLAAQEKKQEIDNKQFMQSDALT